jgi:hypothetical protein
VRAAAVRLDQRLTNAPGLPTRSVLLGFSSRSRASAFSLGLSVPLGVVLAEFGQALDGVRDAARSASDEMLRNLSSPPQRQSRSRLTTVWPERGS